jgi:hypothetical protein
VADDIVKRLLDCGCIVFGGVYVAESRHDCLFHRAADLIEAQQAEIERLRAVERRFHNLWWLAYHHGPVTLTVRGGHEMYRTVTVDGISYNFDDPADVAFQGWSRRG